MNAAAEALTDAELQAVAGDPQLVAKLNADERARMVKLVPAPVSMQSAAPDDAVTLGELVDNPREAMGRIGSILKRDVSDPKVWLTAAALYFGPKALPVVSQALRSGVKGAATGAIKGMAAAGDVVSPDVIGMVSPRAGRAVEVAQRMRGAMATSPAESASGGTAPPSGPPPSGATPVSESAPPTAPTPRPKSPQQILNEEALARRRAEYQARQAQTPAVLTEEFSAAEAQAYRRLREAGMPEATAKQAILNARRAAQQMNQQFGLKTPTEAETKFPKGQRGKAPAPKGSGS